MKRSACLIFNPTAGQGDAEQDLAKIQELLGPEIDLDIRLTTPEVDAVQLVREAVARGVEMIIASGGDGTLSAVAGGVVGTNIPLGIISRGTANAFANALQIPIGIEAACGVIAAGITRVVDAGMCNETQPMVLLAGVGFEAETVELADREAKNRWGMLAYILSGIKQLNNLENFDVTLETEDKLIHFTAAAVTVANVAPATSILAQGPAGLVVDDGLLDITVVAPMNKTGAIAASYHLLQSALRGSAVERDDIGYLQARQVKITTEPPQKVVLDGEIIGTTPLSIECIPGGLTVFVPQVEEVPPSEKLSGLPNLTIVPKGEDEGEEAVAVPSPS